MLDACTGWANHVILYVGDLDKYGERIEHRIKVGLPDHPNPATVRRIALTSEQVAQYNLPRERNDKTGVEKDGYHVDALPPNVFQEIVREAVEAYLPKETQP